MKELGWDRMAVEELFCVCWLDFKEDSSEDWGLRMPCVMDRLCGAKEVGQCCRKDLLSPLSGSQGGDTRKRLSCRCVGVRDGMG
jgi:hypothetical protein